jgi:hypothetical protein
MEAITTIGLDIAKSVFQGADALLVVVEYLTNQQSPRFVPSANIYATPRSGLRYK